MSRLTRKHRSGSLLVVGTGVTGAGQVTLEALAAIDAAERLFYVVADPLTEEWLKLRNGSARSLAGFYAEGKDRRITYAEMANEVIRSVRDGHRVCAAVYGHPGVFAEFPHATIRYLRERGYSARMLAGVSADGCLYADLGVDPGETGVQSFEATDFLRRRRRHDPTSALLLWQVGELGVTDFGGVRPPIRSRLEVLSRSLRMRYPKGHKVAIYVASSFAGHESQVRWCKLNELKDEVPAANSTLYVPALRRQRRADPVVSSWGRSVTSRPRP